jgi:hypothetical protein
MANLNFVGKITHIGTPQTGEGKNGEWTKTTVVVEETDSQFPNSIAFDAFNKQSLVELLAVDQIVDVFYNTKASEANGRYFTNNSIWRVEIKDNVAAPQTSANNTGGNSTTTADKVTTPPAVDDLPF